MTIYKKPRRTKVNYRLIYQQHYGPIPRDQNGKKYEIHHRDGNSHNNHPDNLIALTLQEHYDIHRSQQDWSACLRIAAKMNLSANQISAIAKANHDKRVEEGKHPWQKRADGTSHTKDRISKPNYVNPFTGRNKGTANSNYDSTIHVFYNKLLNKRVEMTQYEFVNTFSVDQGAISKVINGKAKTHKGWVVL